MVKSIGDSSFCRNNPASIFKKKISFSNSDVLPDFELITLKAIQSLGGTKQFTDWFEALNWMQQKMDKIDYDICLIGCGAYGFPLAAHAKRMGKKLFI